MTCDRPSVSVVIATRNRQAFLSEALGSLRAQAFPGLEIVVVDDASDDGTWEWLSAQHDLRAVRMPLRSERSVARNRGLALASAPLVLFLDDDDRIASGGLRHLFDALTDSPSSVAAAGGLVHFDPNGNRRREAHPRFSVTRPVWAESLFDWFANPGRNLFRTDAVRAVGGFDERLTVAEDLDLWLRVVRGQPVTLVPQVVLEARLHPGQTQIDDHRAVVDATTARHASELRPGEAAIADRVRRARHEYWRAVDALDASEPITALKALLRAVRIEPLFLRAPVARRRLLRVGGKIGVGVVSGRRGLGAMRRTIAALRRRTKRDAWRQTSSAPSNRWHDES